MKNFRVMIKLLMALSAALYIGGCDLTSTNKITAEDIEQRLQPWLIGEIADLNVPESPQPLGEQPVQLANGETIQVKDLKGKAMLINFWASWCAPCRAEMKELANLQTEVGSGDFEVVAINADRGGLKMAEKTLAEWGVEGLALYADPSLQSVQHYAPIGLPTSLIVDKHGQIIARFIGPLKWDAAESVKFFKALASGSV